MTFHVPGLHLQDVRLEVPLDYADPSGPQLQIYARVLTAKGGQDRPYLVYLQGGPGAEAPRPAAHGNLPAWQQRLLGDYQLVMLDQRGTGHSSPVGQLSGTAQEQADYLAHFRADSIAQDAERVRQHLGAERWTLLGQSFGGFCTLTYLSQFAPFAAGALFTGGLPAPGHHIDEVYRLTWDKMREKSESYYRRYPEDRARLERLMERARDGQLLTERGHRVTPEMLRRIGMALGGDGGAETLHFFLELDPESPAFRADLASWLPFRARNPLYLLLHEACWADGFATRWAAERTMPQDFVDDPTLLAGEHPHRDFLEHDPLLRPYREVAELLAEREWGPLYDQARLAEVQTPAAAAIYVDDAFVPFEFSRETAKLLPGLRPYITNEFEHGGIRSSGDKVMDRVVGLLEGMI